MPKKKKKEDSPPDIGTVMTVSLFLILLTFFILLNSIARIDERRSRVALGSLLGAFGSLPGGLSAMDSGSSIAPPSAPMIEQSVDLMQLLTRSGYYSDENIQIEPSRSGEKITIRAAALFSPDGRGIDPSIQPFLERLCRYVNQGDYPLDIAGHTDNTPGPGGEYDVNWESSAMMAIRLLTFFVEKGGVDPHRISAFGCGSQCPIASNQTRKSRMENRRVEITLSYKSPSFIRRIYQKRQSRFFTYKKFDFKIF